MGWTLTDDIASYANAVAPLLAGEPVRYTALASVLASLTKHGRNVYGDLPPVLGWWTRDGVVAAAALRTPPQGMLISDLPGPAASELAEAVAAKSTKLSGVIGGEPDATAFASAWSAITAADYRVVLRMRLFRLGTLTPRVPGPDGAARIATSADSAIAYAWHDEFAAETGQCGTSAAAVDDQLRTGRFVLWEVAGEPRSIASLTPVLKGVARIGQVYTPPALRGRGYAGAVTVATSRLAQERGADQVTLFTDVANPISNALYLKLGYQPVEDRVEIKFDH